LAIATYTWEASKFLGVQQRAAQIARACDIVAALDDQTLREVVASAALVWERVDEPTASAWLIGRRDNLRSAFEQTPTPPWAP